jgi:hypothetical protein
MKKKEIRNLVTDIKRASEMREIENGKERRRRGEEGEAGSNRTE